MVDSHCHLDLQAEAAESWERARRAGLSQAILAGVDSEGWRNQSQLCAGQIGLSRTAGLHPWTVAGMPADQLEEHLEALRKELDHTGSDLVGLGELGLDRSRRLEQDTGLQFELQIHAFRAQLELARDRELPLVLHIVRAHGLALEIVEEIGIAPSGGMVHSFSGSAEIAKRWMDHGLYISISPQVQSERARRLRALVAGLPEERLLVETDSPDQCAEPGDLHRVIEAVADLRGERPEDSAARTASNARRLFGLGSIS
jgi:TatD DNase family protein